MNNSDLPEIPIKEPVKRSIGLPSFFKKAIFICLLFTLSIFGIYTLAALIHVSKSHNNGSISNKTERNSLSQKIELFIDSRLLAHKKKDLVQLRKFYSPRFFYYSREVNWLECKNDKKKYLDMDDRSWDIRNKVVYSLPDSDVVSCFFVKIINKTQLVPAYLIFNVIRSKERDSIKIIREGDLITDLEIKEGGNLQGLKERIANFTIMSVCYQDTILPFCFDSKMKNCFGHQNLLKSKLKKAIEDNVERYSSTICLSFLSPKKYTVGNIVGFQYDFSQIDGLKEERNQMIVEVDHNFKICTLSLSDMDF